MHSGLREPTAMSSVETTNITPAVYATIWIAQAVAVPPAMLDAAIKDPPDHTQSEDYHPIQMGRYRAQTHESCKPYSSMGKSHYHDGDTKGLTFRELAPPGSRYWYPDSSMEEPSATRPQCCGFESRSG